MTATKESVLRLIDVKLGLVIDALGSAIAEVAEETGEPYDQWRDRFMSHRGALERLQRNVNTYRKTGEVPEP